MLAQGIHPKIVQERLRHASISMTLDQYSHVSPKLPTILSRLSRRLRVTFGVIPDVFDAPEKTR
jgi:integrase